MIKSMTAFSRVQRQTEPLFLCWEIRSINHRYLDIAFRIPETYRYLETQLRTILKEQVSRGRIECQLKYELFTDEKKLQINENLVTALLHSSQQLSLQHQIANDLKISHVFSFPGVISAETFNTEDYSEQVTELFSQAIFQLNLQRQNEGSALNKIIYDRLDKVSKFTQDATQLAEKQIVLAKERLHQRFETLRIDCNDARLEQELALLISRLDVSEELDRLVTHTQEVKRTLDSDDVAGRRLDFLMQELNREANTLSSKADLAELAQIAVELKVLIEQMREQIQNIE